MVSIKLETVNDLVGGVSFQEKKITDENRQPVTFRAELITRIMEIGEKKRMKMFGLL